MKMEEKYLDNIKDELFQDLTPLLEKLIMLKRLSAQATSTFRYWQVM